MNLVKCEHGHYYNADKLNTCPHCAGEAAKISVEDATGKEQSDIDTLIPDKVSQEVYEQTAYRRLTGWLVCISGNMYGDCFTLFSGDNHIGRDTSMDVSLFREPTVSRCDHAIITYDEVYANFTLRTDSNTVLLNNKPLPSVSPVKVNSHDKITLGDCTLIFVPLCGEHFQWSED